MSTHNIMLLRRERMTWEFVSRKMTAYLEPQGGRQVNVQVRREKLLSHIWLDID